MVKNRPAMQETQETQLWSLGWESPLKEEMATCFSILAWKIPWTEDPGELPRVRQDWAHMLLRKMKKKCCASALDMKSACSGSTSLWLSPEIMPETLLCVKTSPERIWNLYELPGILARPPRSHTIQPCLYHRLSPCPKCPRETPTWAADTSRRRKEIWDQEWFLPLQQPWVIRTPSQFYSGHLGNPRKLSCLCEHTRSS